MTNDAIFPEKPSDPQPKRAAPAPKISFVSLGCPKALVDSEHIISRLRAEGYELTRDHQGADAVIVNTCGFLDSAKAESLAAIGSAMAENGKVIVTGCLGAEKDTILARFENLLGITGPQDFRSVMAAVHAAAPPPHDPRFDLVPKFTHSASRPPAILVSLRRQARRVSLSRQALCPRFQGLAKVQSPRKHAACL